MKKTVNFITVAVMAIMLSSAGAYAQDVSVKAADEKKKQEELQKQAELQKKDEYQKQADLQKKAEYQKQKALDEEMKLKQAEIEAKRKEIQEKMADVDAASEKNQKEFEWIYKEFDDLSRHGRDVYRERPVVVMPDMPELSGFNYDNANNIYLFSGYGLKSKPGSSWNYSRQVMEATFSNELSMSAEDMDNVSLSVSGDCAEGSIVVTIVMPDGKQLSEVILDENGSLNWRKSFEAGEGNGWKNGKWTFRIKAKEATGNLRISMNSY
jgi:flagellar biosynthesis GTPase FlhF